MNRQIKFRVWDKEKLKFLINDHTKNIEFNLWDWADSMSTCLIFPLDSYIFQEYTGLTDKNKNPICEGDIVSFLYEASEHEVEREIGEVTFSEGIFYFGKSLFASNDVTFSVDSIEILGNIYTKPCTPDPNGECLHCDEPIDTCAFKSVPSNKF